MHTNSVIKKVTDKSKEQKKHVFPSGSLHSGTLNDVCEDSFFKHEFNTTSLPSSVRKSKKKT